MAITMLNQKASAVLVRYVDLYTDGEEFQRINWDHLQ
jgi:hypothetical protein